MATLDALTKDPVDAVATGIPIELFPSDVQFDLVIERAPDVAGSPGTWVVIDRVRAQRLTGVTYIDLLPVNGVDYWYRVYHARLGYVNGPATTTPYAAAAGHLSQIAGRGLTPVHLDGVLDGTDFKKTTPTEKTGAGYGYTNLDPDGLKQGSKVAGLPADIVARMGYGVYRETFEVDPNWTVRAGTATISYPSNGQSGGKVVRAVGYDWQAFPSNIPFDPAKLYRMTARVRMVTAPSDSAKDLVYIGVEGVAANGTTLVNRTGANLHTDQHQVGVAALNMGAYALSEWVDVVGWFRGTGAAGASVASTDPRAPAVLHTNVRYIRPLRILNFSGGNGTMECDSIAIDVFDEEGMRRLYEALVSDSALSPQMQQTDGVQVRALVRGRQRSINVKNGDTIVFSPAFQNIPQATWISGGIPSQPFQAWDPDGSARTMRGSIGSGSATLNATLGTFSPGEVGYDVRVAGAGVAGATLVAEVLTYISPTQVTLDTNASTAVVAAFVSVNSTGPFLPSSSIQYREVLFEGLTAAQCIVRARLRQKGAGQVTARTDTFAVGNLDAVGEEKQVTLGASAPAHDQLYTVEWTVDLDAEMPLIKAPDWYQIAVTVELSHNGADGSSFVVVLTRTYTCLVEGYGNSLSDTFQDSETFYVPSLGTGEEFRIRITAIESTGNPSGVGSVLVDPVEVNYATSAASGDMYASLTPDPDDYVTVQFEDASAVEGGVA